MITRDEYWRLQWKIGKLEEKLDKLHEKAKEPVKEE